MLTDADLAQIQAMIDAAPGVGEGFPQPIVAGQQLLIPGIQSPNFSLAGKTGWQLLVSGLATFFNVVLSGGTVTGPDYILNPQGFFFYNGAPANGNLIISVAPAAGVDGFGNNYPAGIEIFGATTFQSNSGNNTAVLGAGSLQFFFILANLLTLSSQGVFLYTAPGGAGNLITSLASSAGADPYGNAYPQGLMGQQLTLVNQAVTPAAFAGGSVFFSGSGGRPRFVSSSGANNILVRRDVNVSQFTVGNIITPGAVISSPMTYQAGESNQSSDFEIKISGLATMAAAGLQNLLFELYIDGAPTAPVTKISASPTGWAANQVIAYTLAFTISFLSTGAAATAVCIGSGIANLGGTGGPGNTVGLNTGPGGGGAVSIDSTVTHTFQVRAYWANASAGQGLTTYRTALTRSD